MNAIEVLASDHHKVRRLFVDFRAAAEAKDAAKMGELVADIFTELDRHTAIEERIFYPAVKEAGGEELAEQTGHSREEHHSVDLLMAEIRTLDPGDDAFTSKMKVLMESVEHHAGEEEKEMFPKVQELFSADELEELGERLSREKIVVDVENMSPEQLRQAAESLDLDVRSNLNATELQSAVLGAMTGGARG